MSSRSRSLALFGMFGSALALIHCSELTKVDWSAIPTATSGGGLGGRPSSSGAAGEMPGAEAGASGEGGAAGEAGMGGVPGEGATGGTFGGGGNGGTGGSVGGGGNGGTGGNGGSGNDGSGGAPVHKVCVTAPTSGVAGAGNLAATLASSMVFFDGGAGGTGNRGGRAGLDAACKAAKTKLALPQQETHAVISVTGFDEIFHNGNDDIYHMPETYKIPRKDVPIVSPLGIPIASSWNTLWRFGDAPSLVCSGVMPAESRTWLTGTQKMSFLVPGGDALLMENSYGFYDYTQDTAGVFSNNTCNGWTSDAYDDNSQARVGSTVADHDVVPMEVPRFFFYRLDACNGADGNVLCVAYNPTP